MSKDKFIWDEEPIVEKEVVKEDYEKIFGNKKEIEEVEDIDISDKSVDIIDDKKHSNKKIILSIIIFILFLIIIPLFRVEKIVINELNFIKQEEVLNKIKVEKNKSYSILRLVTLGMFYKNDFVGKSSFKYNFKDKSINISIEENKPLARNKNGKIAYKSGNKIIDVEDAEYIVPNLSGFEKEDEIIELIGKLKYEIIKEMVLIHNTGENDLLFIEMKDGNYVKIYMSQFEQKMPYYLQIKQIIKSQAKKSKGILHLDRGDYYEPK